MKIHLLDWNTSVGTACGAYGPREAATVTARLANCLQCARKTGSPGPLAMGPLIWEWISLGGFTPVSRAAISACTDEGGYPLSREYYAAIDAVNRGERAR